MTLTQIKPLGLSKPVDLADNEKIRLGTGNDLQIYHNGTENIIATNNSAVLQIRCNGTEKSIEVNPDGNVELYHDNNKKLETTSGGVLATGDFDSTTGIFERTTGFTSQLKFTDSNETQLIHGSNGQVKLSFIGTSSAARGSIDAQSGFIRIKTATDDTGVICRDNSSTDLRFDDSKKFETTSTGVTVTGNVNLGDNGKLLLGASDDLQIFHSGSSNRIYTYNGTIDIRNAASGQDENMISMIPDGAVELYHNGSKKFETNTAGVIVTDSSDGTVNIKLVNNSGDAGFVYSDGTNTGILDSQGHWTVKGIKDAATELYYDNNKQLETTADGIDVQGHITLAASNNAPKITFDENGANDPKAEIQMDQTSSTDGNLIFKTEGSGTLSERMRIAAGGNVMIGTTTEGFGTYGDEFTIAKSAHAGMTIRSGTGSKGSIYFSDGTSGDAEYRGGVQYDHSDDSLRLSASAATRVRVDSDGLKFGSDTAAANALDDYEEGTWTPSAVVTHNGSGSGSVSSSNVTGLYTKIGRQVTCHVSIQINASNISGCNVGLNGLPFTISSSSVNFNVGVARRGMVGGEMFVFEAANHNTTQIEVMRMYNNNGLSDGNQSIKGMFVYTAAT